MRLAAGGAAGPGVPCAWSAGATSSASASDNFLIVFSPVWIFGHPTIAADVDACDGCL
jgi:hypothetical protein